MWVVLSEVEMFLIMVLLPGCSVSITFSRIMKIFWLKNLPACIISFFWVFFFWVRNPLWRHFQFSINLILILMFVIY